MDNMRIGGCSCQEVPADTKHWFCPTHGNCTRGVTPEMGLKGAMTHEEKAREIVGRDCCCNMLTCLQVCSDCRLRERVVEALASAEKCLCKSGIRGKHCADYHAKDSRDSDELAERLEKKADGMPNFHGYCSDRVLWNFLADEARKYFEEHYDLQPKWKPEHKPNHYWDKIKNEWVPR